MDQRIILSVQAALLYFIVASPTVFRFTSGLFKTTGNMSTGVSALIYGILVYLVMLLNAR
jgi:hypothetical protein